ncbi:hypothetical protein GYH30_025226 [Glycine max]|uniref:Uncharacterized protein n=1 Tax=Glycine max TaxID=3847 RepID=K7LE91_SOYBN|nr:hypothetical protein GYH30_025226 [Glycine max]
MRHDKGCPCQRLNVTTREKASKENQKQLNKQQLQKHKGIFAFIHHHFISNSSFQQIMKQRVSVSIFRNLAMFHKWIR